MSNSSPGEPERYSNAFIHLFLEALPSGNGSMWLLLILLFTTLGVMDEVALSQHMLTFPSIARQTPQRHTSLALLGDGAAL